MFGFGLEIGVNVEHGIGDWAGKIVRVLVRIINGIGRRMNFFWRGREIGVRVWIQAEGDGKGSDSSLKGMARNCGLGS